MAFQRKQPFFAFLQGTAAGTALEEVAPAENFVLDERVPGAREDDFLALSGFATAAHSKDSWFKQHTDYTKSRVALPAVSETFSAINQTNWRPEITPDSDVVRVETLYGLDDRARKKGSHIPEAKVASLIREFLTARDA